MKLLEYEAKAILKSAGVPVPQAEIITSDSKIIPAAPCVLKSQVPTGGRGKLGGIRIVKKSSDIQKNIQELFNLPLRGRLPSAILAEELVDVKREFYLSLFVDHTTADIQVIAHHQGGIEVEEHHEGSFLKLSLTSTTPEAAGEQLAEYYDLPDQSFVLQDLMQTLHACFITNDATLIEINPLILTTQATLVAGDCKMTVDDAAAFRHPEWDFQDKPAEVNFVTLDQKGTIATIANGAGLAMATVDAVADAGLTPANFLDIGGGANKDSVLAAFRTIMEYPSVRAIVINIFAGITRCDEVAKAIIAAKNEIAELPPLYIRLAGTNYEAALSVLEAERIALHPNLPSCIAAIQEDTP